jgi:hypothetical protein
MGRQLYRRRTWVGGLAAAAVKRLISAPGRHVASSGPGSGHLIPLVRIASDRDLMHLVPTRRATIAVAWLVIGVVRTLNLILIGLIAAGV